MLATPIFALVALVATFGLQASGATFPRESRTRRDAAPNVIVTDDKRGFELVGCTPDQWEKQMMPCFEIDSTLECDKAKAGCVWCDEAMSPLWSVMGPCQPKKVDCAVPVLGLVIPGADEPVNVVVPFHGKGQCRIPTAYDMFPEEVVDPSKFFPDGFLDLRPAH